ncbi:MAG: hypothetical protein KC620_22745 [Myxococcales bacterium]|nr:hypothetical protein [Myxococcales bacterium]
MTDPRPLRALALLAVFALAACDTQESDDPAPPDVTVADAAPDVALADATPPADAAPPVDAAPQADAAPDPCETACARLTECAVNECEGDAPVDAAAISAECAALCAATPPLANVLIGAETCETVLDFGRDRLGEGFEDACPGAPVDNGLPPPRTDVPCPFECHEGEQCLDGYCVRDDGTCDTDYHCLPGRAVCEEGRCAPAEFAPCRGDRDCHSGHQCRFFNPDPLAPGTCVIPCQADDPCPFEHECNLDFGGLCYFAICGPGTGNGTLYQDCAVGAAPGTCYPLSLGQARQGQPGYCIEGGTAPVGAPCDSQARTRDEASAALRCAPGGVCFGDADNPLDPDDEADSQGECVNLCDPRNPTTCTDLETCFDFSGQDDPDTAFDETQPIGACLRTDCSVFAPADCGEGQHCTLYTVTNDRGRCGPAGEVALGAPCQNQDDCAGNAICGGNGRDEMVCVADCDPMGEACPEGQFCYAEPTWRVGFCIYAPPEADGGAPDAGPADAAVDAEAPDAGLDAMPVEPPAPR